jgi:hypothetical protein
MPNLAAILARRNCRSFELSAEFPNAVSRNAAGLVSTEQEGISKTDEESYDSSPGGLLRFTRSGDPDSR